MSKLKIMFYTDVLNYRGTAVAIADYAHFNQELLGNESVICYGSNRAYEKDLGTEPDVLAALQSKYQVLGYTGDNINQLVDDNKIDVAYFIRSGDRGFLPDNCKTLVHSVFQLYEPHGDKYAYVSEWLALTMNLRHNARIPSVPHIVNLPEPTENLRKTLGIPAGQTVIGRHGGYFSFDLPWAAETIAEILNERSNYTFLFLGTRPWINHPRVIFLPENHNLQYKVNFINTCDAMIHARSDGESFGLSIAEFLSQNKPVIAANGGNDHNHLTMLAGSGLLYNNRHELKQMLLNFKDIKQDWTARIAESRPEAAMAKFKQVFL